MVKVPFGSYGSFPKEMFCKIDKDRVQPSTLYSYELLRISHTGDKYWIKEGTIDKKWLCYIIYVTSGQQPGDIQNFHFIWTDSYKADVSKGEVKISGFLGMVVQGVLEYQLNWGMYSPIADKQNSVFRSVLIYPTREVLLGDPIHRVELIRFSVSLAGVIHGTYNYGKHNNEEV